MTESELRARYNIKVDNYQKIVQIEARVLGDIALNHIIPAALKFQSSLIENTRGLKEIYDAKTFKSLAKTQLETIEEIGNRVNFIQSQIKELAELRSKIDQIQNNAERSKAYCDEVLPYFKTVRLEVDKLEHIVDNELWPLPKYRELLFAR